MEVWNMYWALWRIFFEKNQNYNLKIFFSSPYFKR